MRTLIALLLSAAAPGLLFLVIPPGAHGGEEIQSLAAAETIERLFTADGAVQVFIIRSGDTDSTEVVVVQNGKAGVVILGGGSELPPVPPPDPPAESTLSVFVRGLTVKVEATADERQEVADIFTRGARKIRDGELRGSLALQEWTDKEMEDRLAWAAWYLTVWRHVLKLDELEFFVAEKWAVAWDEIGKGVGS